MIEALQFRDATLADLAHLRELEQAVVEAERPFNNSIKASDAIYYDLESLIESDLAKVLVAKAQDEIIATGYVDIRLSKPSLKHSQHGYLGFMYVAPDYRGQGLNRQIMSMLMDWARSQGIADFYLDVYAQNEAAIRAYQKAGFVSSMIEMKLS